ncbi:MAG: hypothetical protein M3460_27635 [Actinomycetota bacterium]|nr:hypothetical protein [Actinomycetota bacterium]
MYYRSCRKRKRLFGHNRGFLAVNDGPVFASQLARYLASLVAIDTADPYDPYRQIADQLRAAIGRVGLQPGDRPPSKTALMDYPTTAG